MNHGQLGDSLRSSVRSVGCQFPHLFLEEATVGIEHEFFLFDSNGELATEDLSQNFFRAMLLRNPSFMEFLGEPDFIAGIYLRDHARTPTKISYDHPPHLLEISTSPARCLQDAERVLRRALSVAKQAADEIGAELRFSCLIDSTGANCKIRTQRKKWRDLRHYRSRLLSSEDRDTGFDNYAALIAATQTHVQLPWWDCEDILDRLYRLEPSALDVARQTAGLITSDLIRRWIGYRTVFRRNPLVGFPDMSKWSLTNWIDGLLNAPLAGAAGDPWAALTVAEYGHFPNDTIEDFWSSVRDLQIIRPRLFGTIEFRADPAMPNEKAILRMAALRLGLVTTVLNGYEPSSTFEAARSVWWGKVRGEIQTREDKSVTDLLSLAVEGLERRGLREEQYLIDWNGR